MHQNFGLLIWTFCLVGLISCGQPGSPTGGPRDKEPPEVSQTFPTDSSLNVDTRIVRFFFNEAVRKPTFDKEIYISPLVKRPKIILSDNAKRLTIQFQEDLRPQTTYIVTLTDVKDLNESNALAAPYVLAFSTGDILDSMEIKGSIQSPVMGETEDKMLVMLFDADSIQNDVFDRVRPAYITQSDEQGNFGFKYLRNTSYRVMAVTDEDKSNTYSGPLERVAIMEDSLITFSDTSKLAEVSLFAFSADPVLPNLRSYLWVGDSSMSLTFSKNLKLDEFQAWVTDTLNQDSTPITSYSWLEGEKPQMYVYMPRPKDSLSVIHLTGLVDSLGNRMDTTFSVSDFRYKVAKEVTLVTPSLSFEPLGWEIFPPQKINPTSLQWIVLTDTAAPERRDTLEYTFQREGFRLYIQPVPIPDTALLYVLRLNGSLADTAKKDTTFRFPLSWYSESDYGSLSGSVRLDSPFSGPVILELYNDKKKRIGYVRDTTFAFPRLLPGSYTARVILDTDSNGVWTPGNIIGRIRPEQIFVDPTPIQIRANWEFDDQVIQVREILPAAPVDTTQVVEEGGEIGDEN